ncbi:hypothetical protein GCM10025858_05610 [Alicyclobacillus sacchari]|uniref:hypothetical protein n=1 Tax=Alicyclobacillus sacchari TaxID=392010 RepID=UPI0023EA198F|nr:hypothetical protein [Alicyclobacillus sacchari]GMA56058.1 hypothetical protein GCM10025858_05610 [Alicyclobacillus sacchari]
MCTKADCERYVGKMVGFRTKYGYHVGFVERVTHDSAVILSPRKYIPTEFASANVSDDELQRLDLALAQWGGAPGAGYGGWGAAMAAGVGVGAAGRFPSLSFMFCGGW